MGAVLKKHEKAQSATEYMITYGWVLIVVFIILAVLFKFGFFSATNFSPKSQTGSCQVLRPSGANSTQFISLEGTCANEIPQFVAQFQGQHSYLNVTSNIYMPGNQMTVGAWVYPTSFGTCGGGTSVIASKTSGYPSTGEFYLALANTSSASATFGVWSTTSSATVSTGSGVIEVDAWSYLVGTYNGVTMTIYLNGVKLGTSAFTGTILSATNVAIYGGTNIGTGSGVAGYCHTFQGNIANVQLYTKALSSNEVSRLYVQGIGSPPIDLNDLQAWWPLNGNGNDYGGNGYSVGIANATWNGGWSSTYSPT